jgi:hypothetical protein
MDRERLKAANGAAELVKAWEYQVKQVEDMETRNPLHDLFFFPEDPPMAFWTEYQAKLLLWARAKLKEAQERFDAA